MFIIVLFDGAAMLLLVYYGFSTTQVYNLRIHASAQSVVVATRFSVSIAV